MDLEQVWVKLPAPSQIRGEGKWFRADKVGYSVKDIEDIEKSGYVPIHHGESPPKDN